MGILGPAALWADNIAILPFANHSSPDAPASSAAGAAKPALPAASANLDWIGESIAENLRDALSTKGLLTVERDDVEEAYRRLKLRPRANLTQASALKVGEALDAAQVVYGTFEFIPDLPKANAAPSSVGNTAPSTGTLKITARVSDRRKLRQGPEFSESGSIDELPMLEAHLTWRTLTLLAPKLAPPEADYKVLRTPVRLDAEENYVRGLMSRSPAQREKFFLQASRLDVRFTHPEYALGRIYYDRKQYKQAADLLQKIPSGDVHYREASFLLGLALFQSGDFAGSQKAFQAVADSVPIGEVMNNLAAAQSRRNLPQALESFQKAQEGDPKDVTYIFNVGYALWKKNDFEHAAERFRALLARTPDDEMATLLLGLCLKKQGLRPTDVRLGQQERLKTTYEERAYWELKAMLDPDSGKGPESAAPAEGTPAAAPDRP